MEYISTRDMQQSYKYVGFMELRMDSTFKHWKVLPLYQIEKLYKTTGIKV